MECGGLRRALIGLLTMYAGRCGASQISWDRRSWLALRACSFRLETPEERRLLNGSHLELTSAFKGAAAAARRAGASNAQRHQDVFVFVGFLVNRPKLYGALFVLQLHPHRPRLANCTKEVEQIVVVEADAQGCAPVRDIHNFVGISVFPARTELEPSLLKVEPKRVGALIGKQSHTTDRGRD
jgi:hypothetical protein